MEPILDLVTILIFLGVVQAFFLAASFTHRRYETVSNLYFGLLLFAVAAIILEILLGYSGYITRVIHLVDFSEPFNFTLGPLLYLAIRTRLGAEPFSRRQLVHLIPFALYAIYHIPYMMQSGDFKETAWLEAWRAQDTDAIGAVTAIDVDPLRIRRVVAELTIFHASIYIVASIRVLADAFRAQGLPLSSKADPELAFWRRFVLQFLALLVVVAFVKSTFPADLGDYIIAVIGTVIIYVTSIGVVGRSSLFRPARTDSRKYEKSALTSERRDAVLERLDAIMKEDKPYLQPALTLAELAATVNVSAHHLSQVLNEGAGRTFHEYLGRHRVEEAMRLLSGPDRDTLRIEDIAARVGYYSKSSFNTAFRKIAGVTPSRYRARAGDAVSNETFERE